MGKPVIAPGKRDDEAELAVKDMMRDVLYSENIDQFWERLYSKTSGGLPFVTDVKKAEIPNYVGALWYSELFDLPWLKDLLEYDLSLRVSLDRKGRQEATNVLVGTTEREVRQGMFSSFAGMFRRRKPTEPQA